MQKNLINSLDNILPLASFKPPLKRQPIALQLAIGSCQASWRWHGNKAASRGSILSTPPP